MHKADPGYDIIMWIAEKLPFFIPLCSKNLGMRHTDNTVNRGRYFR